MSWLSSTAWATITVWQARPIEIVSAPAVALQHRKQRSGRGSEAPTWNGNPCNDCRPSGGSWVRSASTSTPALHRASSETGW